MANNQNRASWSSETTKLFLQLLIDEKNSGNWSGKCATRLGNENVAKRLRQITGQELSKAQFKNKFDGLRSVFHLWSNLFHGQTGAGFDVATGRVTMPEEWWASKIQENPTYKKFKINGLEHATEMFTVFQGSSATGEHEYTPTATPRETRQSGHDETSADDTEQAPTPRLDEDVSSPPRTEEGSARSTWSGSKRKRSASDDSWNESLESLRTAIEGVSVPQQHVHKHVMVNSEAELTTQAFNELYALPNLDPDSDLFDTACLLMEDTQKRNVFLNIRGNEAKVRWLKRHAQ